MAIFCISPKKNLNYIILLLRVQTYVPESKNFKMPIAAAASNSWKITEKKNQGGLMSLFIYLGFTGLVYRNRPQPIHE